MILMIWIILFFILRLLESPILILFGLICLGFITRRFFFQTGFFLGFYLWILVYLGGIIIVFTYVVFFSVFATKAPLGKRKRIQKISKNIFFQKKIKLFRGFLFRIIRRDIFFLISFRFNERLPIISQINTFNLELETIGNLIISITLRSVMFYIVFVLIFGILFFVLYILKTKNTKKILF